MYLHALATANPPRSFTQTECLGFAQSPELRAKLNRRSQLILHAVLARDSGIDKRHFAVTDIPGVYNYSSDRLNESFRKAAPELAGEALTKALAQAGLRADELDVLLICTCTGYLCPGVTSYVGEQLGLRPDAILHDVVGLGCGAAIPTLRAAHAYLQASPKATVATVAVEICSAAFYLDDDPGVLISACLFGDGAAAAIWKSEPGPTGLRCRDFASHHQPADRDKIRFEQRDGKLRNLLSSEVPALAAAAVAQLFEGEQRRENAVPIRRIGSHPGGKDVIEALEQRLAPFSFEPSRRVLRAFGNMSSASVLFVLEDMLRESPPGGDGDWWLVSFGAGFSVHGCRIGF
jgi:predicted naringenin-chalcone synthase